MLESKILMYPHEFIARTDPDDGVMIYYIRHLDPAEDSDQTEEEVEVPESVFDRLLRMAQSESMRTIADSLDPWREVPSGEYPPIASRIDDIYKLLEHMLSSNGSVLDFGTKQDDDTEPS